MWRDGRKDILEKIKESTSGATDIVWMHCASLGEFEQGRPVLEKLKQEDVQLVDCQVYTEHLESLGARMISRDEFLQLLAQLIS